MWGLQKQDERKQAARCRECANARHSEIVRERYAVTARARYVVKELQHVMYKEDPQSVEDDLPMITNNWRFSKEHKQFPTVRHRGMETGISEASKRVSIFSFATQGGKQVSFHFRQRNWVQPERLRSGFLQADLSLIV